ncbi:MAG: lytic transglycosylase domain-containing protein, partial [Alphaproteobacteria bacterium]|nr:lytic transglycosylase domain-containing protein [Alphaproteobacteria bacterium]
LRAEFKDVLEAKDYQIRIDMLLKQNRIDEAQTVVAWLNSQLKWFPAGQRDLARMRIALLENDPAKKDELEQRLTDTKAIFKDDPGLLYEEIKWRRINREDDKLFDLLQSDDSQPLEILDPELVWGERNILVRRKIEQKEYAKALELINRHRLKTGEHYVNAEWLASFIMIEFLKQPEQAYDRLVALKDKVRMPISRSKLAYWLAVAAEKMDSPEQAYEWLKTAAMHPATYYGQLAIHKLEEAKKPIPKVALFESKNIALPYRRRFEARPFVRIIRHIARMGEPIHYIEKFFDQLTQEITSPEEKELLIALAGEHVHPKIAVRLSRQTPDNMIVNMYTYPTLSTEFMAQTVEKIAPNNNLFHYFVLALIRRESGFDANALSPAGARGLMQIMNDTAKNAIERLSFLCKDCAIQSNDAQSFTVPSNNVAIGASHLKELMERYNGSFVLALCAYN